MDVNFLTRFKGAPLSILVALLAYGPATPTRLAGRTGYSSRTIRDTVVVLVEEGFLQLESGVVFVVAGAGLPQEFFAAVDNLPIMEKISTRAEIFSTCGNFFPSSSSNNNTTTREVFGSELSTPCGEEILRVCREVGIGEPKRSLLASLPHIIEAGSDYVRWHVEQARRDGLRLGAAIWRMEQGWPAEVVEKRPSIPGHLKDIIKS